MSEVLSIDTHTKKCYRCGEMKSLSEFNQNAGNGRVGVTRDCASCRANKKRETWKKTMDKRRQEYIPPVTKVCSRCKEEKPLSAYAKANWTMIGITPDCKKCRNERYKDPRGGKLSDRPDKVQRQYGVTYEEIKRALDAQHGLCANRACGKEISLDVKVSPNRAVIDHCHETGRFRALLCTPCNLLLGRVENDKNLLLGLMEYSGKYNEIIGKK